jgi:dTDP-3-amino-3,4,6-trideoxy-alpha-D-glucose transaminase
MNSNVCPLAGDKDARRIFVAMDPKTIQLADFRAAWELNRTAYLEAVERVGMSGWLVLGKEVEQFERDLAKFWGLKHAIGVANGLDALEICFRMLGAKPGDRFLTTPLSAFATTLAILRVGGVPEFVDVDASGVMDLELARKRLADTSRTIRFLVPVHLFGHAMQLSALERLARDFGVEVIEDCAQAIGATSEGRSVGSASRCCATSFYPTKNLGAYGDAGAVLCNDDSLATLARSLRDYGQTDKYVHTNLGLNSRLDELQAALLRSVQLPALAAQTERRRVIATRYLAELKNPGFVIPPVPVGSGSVWHLFPVIVEGDREAFRAHLKSHGVATGLHYPLLISAQQAMAAAGQPLSPEGTFPVAERFAKQEVSLPLHPFLTDEDCARVIAACNSWKP